MAGNEDHTHHDRCPHCSRELYVKLYLDHGSVKGARVVGER